MSLLIEDVSDGKIKLKSVHGAYLKKFKGLGRLSNETSNDSISEYKATNDKIHEVIKEAIDQNVRIRACGSLWSLSEIPYTNGYCLFHKKKIEGEKKEEQTMLFKKFLEHSDLREKGEKRQFLFCQSGNTIKNINYYCLRHGRSLKTTGASNGQTIAGAISTGVHGSTIRVGSIQDTVCGLHLITGSSQEHSIYLEALSNPVVSQSWADSIGATLIRDDKLFHASLVGLGSLGYIHGVTIKTVPSFMLTNYISRVHLSKVYDFIDSLHVDGSAPAGIRIEDCGLNEKGRLWSSLFHMKFYINQYRDKKCVAEIIYQDKPRDRGVRGDQPDFLKYNKDFVFSLGKWVGSAFPFMIPSFINKQFPRDGSTETGTLGQIFKDTTNLRDGQFSCATAIDHRDASRALQLIMKAAKNHKKIPAAFSMRFVKGSKATMAFTRYDINCLFGIDGMTTKATLSFLKKITVILQKEKINHTWHWGKYNFMDDQFASRVYGSDLTDWHVARANILSDSTVADAFTNEYLRTIGIF